MFKVANVGWAWSGVPEIAYSYQPVLCSSGW